jgi:hypothetical protein
MKILPHKNVTLYTSLDEDEVLDRLKEVLGRKLVFPLFSGQDKPYQGTIAGPFFQVSRKRYFEGGPRVGPEIKGRVISETYGSSIELELEPSPLDKGGVFAWVLVGSVVSVIALVSGFDEGSQQGEGVLSAWIFPLFTLIGYFLVFLGFYGEWNITKKFLVELFEAQENPIQE